MAGNLVDYDGVNRTYNAANQLTGDGTNTYEYDNNGNLWKTNSVVSHIWDRANRLLNVGNHSFKYDGLGNRVQQTVSSVVTDYLNDLQPGLTKLLKQDDGTNVEQFVHAPRGIHAVDDGTDWNFYAQDGLGSVRGLVDANAAVNQSLSYDPYGAPDASINGFAFTGEPRDTNGLQYHRARYYDVTLGIWISEDFLETSNRYGYVSGDPINYADPTGLCEQGEGFEQCERLRQLMQSWGVCVIYNGVPAGGECLQPEVVEQIPTTELPWTASEMQAIYDAFSVFDKAHDTFGSFSSFIQFANGQETARYESNYNYQWPLTNKITIAKRQTLEGTGSATATDYGVHFYPGQIFLSNQYWGENSVDGAQYRSWLVLHEFAHIFAKDRAIDMVTESGYLFWLENVSSNLTWAGQISELYMSTPITDYPNLILNPKEFLIEAVTGTIWNFGYRAVDGFGRNAGGRVLTNVRDLDSSGFIPAVNLDNNGGRQPELPNNTNLQNWTLRRLILNVQ